MRMTSGWPAVRAAAAAAAIAAVFVVAGRPALAQTLAFDTLENPFSPGVANQGWYSGIGFHSQRNDNYVVYSFGLPEDADSSVRNFFSFDLSGLRLAGQSVVGATLQARRFSSSSPSGQVTLLLSDVTTPADVLNRDHLFDNLAEGAAIFADLGSGASYGRFTIGTENADPEEWLDFALNEAALSDIAAAAGGWFSIGGTLLTGPEPPNDIFSGVLFGSSGHLDVPEGSPPRPPARNRLLLSVAPAAIPEPGTLALLALGAAAAAATWPVSGRRQRRPRRRRP